ncbi:MAG: hypothetical protein QXL75_00595 [archaeon]
MQVDKIGLIFLIVGLLILGGMFTFVIPGGFSISGIINAFWLLVQGGLILAGIMFLFFGFLLMFF